MFFLVRSAVTVQTLFQTLNGTCCRGCDLVVFERYVLHSHLFHSDFWARRISNCSKQSDDHPFVQSRLNFSVLHLCWWYE